jgi:ribose/xylose/arabinose/galactoside ABC-type transport system permease subunit
MSGPLGDPLGAAPVGTQGRAPAPWSTALRRREGGVLALIVLTVLTVGALNHAFLSLGNLHDISVQAAPAIIVACGLTAVMVMGEIDISMGALMGLLAAVLGRLASSEHAGWPLWAVVPAILSGGAAVGLVTGLIVTVGRVPSIIASLGMLTVLRGACDLVMGGESIGGFPPALRSLAIGSVLGVPVPVAVAGVLVALFAIAARQTPLGLRIYALGSNPHAARLAGLAADRLKLSAFVLTGLLTAVATLVSVPQLEVIEAGFGKGFELLVVTGVVVGGTAVSGGRGTVIGSMLALLLLALVRTVLIFLQLGDRATYWERAIQGAFILVAVLIDRLSRRAGAAP